ncbi:MAG: ribosomal protein [Acidimicrobiales bacterium]|jgi:large subunit ribosomal protein L10|nr:ribosomal protein [Acidimicrobiales bacterium]
MDNPRPEKVAVVDEVRERLSAASAAILTEYRGLNVTEISRLRRALREAGGDYKIYKNTLVRFAARDLGLAEFEAMLTGPTAIAFVETDAAAVAKALRDFGRTNPALVVKGGLLGTKVLSAGDTSALAELPSRDVLLAQLAGAMAAPMRTFAGLLQALPRSLAYGLKALLDQRAADAPPEPPAPEAEAPAPEAEAPAAEAEPAASETEAAAPEAEAPAPEAEAPAVTETPVPENTDAVAAPDTPAADAEPQEEQE